MSAILSVCMIVKNEAKNLANCLKSIKDIANEIIVIDTGSIDNTKEIALNHGAKVYDFEWIDDFSAARNYSIEKATGDWILILDGDDEFEIKDSEKLLNIINCKDSGDICLFNTVCYVGETPGNDKIMNVNIRLFKNTPNLRYQGKIHECLVPKGFVAETKLYDVTIYHYGYLNSYVREQNKRDRNMRILEGQLKDDPENPFLLFCMGNEYYAQYELQKALKCFLPAYKTAGIGDIYTPKLVIRIISCYQIQGNYEEAMKYCEDALVRYPSFTDVEYMKGGIYQIKQNYYKAIKCFENCLTLGEPSSILNFIIGVGTFRPYYSIGNVYCEIGDYDAAIEYYGKCLIAKNDFYDAIYAIGNVLAKKYNNSEEIQKNLEQFFDLKNPNSYAMMGDILFKLAQYKLSLEYILIAIQNNTQLQETLFVKAKCYYYLKMYEKAIPELRKFKKDNKYYLDTQILLFMSYLNSNKFNKAEKVLLTLKSISEDDKLYKVYLSLSNILQSKDNVILSEDEKESAEYLPLIINVLDLLLSVQEVEHFEKALQLLNCIDCKDALIALAKLYNKHGLIKMCVSEIKRSITLFDRIDEECAYILYKSFSTK